MHLEKNFKIDLRMHFKNFSEDWDLFLEDIQNISGKIYLGAEVSNLTGRKCQYLLRMAFETRNNYKK